MGIITNSDSSVCKLVGLENSRGFFLKETLFNVG